ncbi:MAG: sigma-70 family RNA polymerase sigma factor [Clostridia bacterium]|nr:sigma-70 family RNA polymerase sigma factor [Clostridia bacterium]
MTDEKIVEMFWARDERALNETQEKYKNLCMYVGTQILASNEDREECFNDLLLSLWNSIPPEKPSNFRSYIGRSMRNHALNRSRDNNAWKRGKNYQTVGEEFLLTVEDGHSLADGFEAKRAGEAVNRVLDSLGKDDRRIFIMRFYLGMSVADISLQLGFGESKIKVSVHRTRKKIAELMKKEGIII